MAESPVVMHQRKRMAVYLEEMPQRKRRAVYLEVMLKPKKMRNHKLKTTHKKKRSQLYSRLHKTKKSQILMVEFLGVTHQNKSSLVHLTKVTKMILLKKSKKSQLKLKSCQLWLLQKQ
jgi:hypothetical protein